MCGIVGAMAFEGLDPKMEDSRQEALIYLMTEILQQSQSRGKEATGISTLFKDGIFTGQKMGISSPEFIARFGGTKDDFEGYLDGWRRQSQPAAISIAHCRKSSVGNSWDNVNNHPIKVGEIVGIHNGTLKNHNIILKNLGGKRDGVVDSEAIMRLVHHYSENGKLPFTVDMIQEVVARLERQYACLIYSGNNPYQMVTFRDMRPMVYALIRPLKTVIVASERSFLENAFFKVNKSVKLYNNPYKWPAFTRDAIQFKDLPDEHIGIFNLTAEIGEKTDIEDLVEIEKIPRIGKLWKTGYINQNTYNQNQNQSKRAADLNKANADTQTSGMAEVKARAVTDNKKVVSGRLYNKELRSYVMMNSGADDETKESGMTIINANGKKNKVDTLTTREDKATGVGKSAGDVENQNKTSSAAIIELDPVAGVGEDVDGNKASGKNKEKVVTETVNIDMSIDADALDEATNRAESLEKFSNDKDVMIALEIAEETSLKELAPHALANRMRKFAYKTGLYDGIVSAKRLAAIRKASEQNSGLKMARASEDSKEVQKKIRQLKNTTRILTTIINDLSSKSSVDSSIMERAVISVLDMKKDVDAETLNNMYSIGDYKKDSILRQVRDMVQSKEARK